MNLIIFKLKILNYVYIFRMLKLLVANKKPFETFSLSNVRDLFERDFNLVKFLDSRLFFFQRKGFRSRVLYPNFLQIMIEFRNTNTFFSSNFLGRCLLSRSLGFKKKRNYSNKLINKKRKLNFVSFKDCTLSFVMDLGLKVKKLELKKKKVLIFLKGNPLPGQFNFFFRSLKKSLKNQLTFMYLLNSNPLIFKSGLREKKLRRT